MKIKLENLTEFNFVELLALAFFSVMALLFFPLYAASICWLHQGEREPSAEATT